MTPKEQKDLIRFFKYVRVNRETGCWEWVGHRNEDGYGRFNTWDGHQHSFYAHRWLYIQLIGPVEDGKHMDHYVCNNRACVNPLHLRVTTPSENEVRANRVRWGKRYRNQASFLEDESPF